MFSNDYLSQFNNLANDLSSQGYWHATNIFKEDSYNLIANNFNKNINNFKPAQIGKGSSKSNNTQIRNDKNLWLNQNENGLEPVWELLNNISDILKSHLYFPIKRYESQFALYPPGHFYKRHVDKHKNLPARLVTLVYYISSWEKSHEGELMIYNKNSIKIEPVKNSLVIFLSELEHEVKPTNSNRQSLTAWFRDDIL